MSYSDNLNNKCIVDQSCKYSITTNAIAPAVTRALQLFTAYNGAGVCASF